MKRIKDLATADKEVKRTKDLATADKEVNARVRGWITVRASNENWRTLKTDEIYSYTHTHTHTHTQLYV